MSVRIGWKKEAREGDGRPRSGHEWQGWCKFLFRSEPAGYMDSIIWHHWIDHEVTEVQCSYDHSINVHRDSAARAFTILDTVSNLRKTNTDALITRLFSSCIFRVTTLNRPDGPEASLRNVSVKLQPLRPPKPAARVPPVHRETSPGYGIQRYVTVSLPCIYSLNNTAV